MTKEQLDALKVHTPGPWALADDRQVQRNDGAIIATAWWFGNKGSVSKNESAANAKLIAAAPDLLDHIDEQQRKIDRIQDEMRRYLPILEALEAKPSSWEWFTDGTGIATLNGYRAALKEAENE